MASQDKANKKEARAEKALEKKQQKAEKAITEKQVKAAKQKKVKRKGKNPFKAIAEFFKKVNSERKKVIWPSAKETLKNSLVVLVVCLIAGVAIYAVDTVLSTGMKGIKSAADSVTTTTTEAAEEETDANSDAEADTESDTESETEDTTEDTTEATE